MQLWACIWVDGAKSLTCIGVAGVRRGNPNDWRVAVRALAGDRSVTASVIGLLSCGSRIYPGFSGLP